MTAVFRYFGLGRGFHTPGPPWDICEKQNGKGVGVVADPALWQRPVIGWRRILRSMMICTTTEITITRPKQSWVWNAFERNEENWSPVIRTIQATTKDREHCVFLSDTIMLQCPPTRSKH